MSEKMMNRTETKAGPTLVSRPAGLKPVQKRRNPQAAVDSYSPDFPQSGSSLANSPNKLLLKVSHLQKKLVSTNYTLKIKLDPETGKNLVKVIDRETGEVLREIPDKEMLRNEANIQRMIGLFFDRQV